MADKIDAVLRDYFTGALDLKIVQRKRELDSIGATDENVGGGRAQNKHTRPLDDMIIRYESDYELQALFRQRRIMKEWLSSGVCDKETNEILKLHYGKKYTWDKISNELFIGRNTAIRKRNWFKRVLAVQM